MKLKIRYKLFFTLLLTSTVAAAGLFLFLQWSFDRGFLNYVKSQELTQLDQLAEQLTSYYAEENNWRFIVHNHPLWRRIHIDAFSSSPGGLPHKQTGEMNQIPRFPRPPMGTRDLGPRIILYNENKKKIIGGPHDYKENLALRSINYQGKVIGYLGLIPVTELSHSGDLLFVKQQTETFALVTLVMVGLSMLLAFPVTSHLLRPYQGTGPGNPQADWRAVQNSYSCHNRR